MRKTLIAVTATLLASTSAAQAPRAESSVSANQRCAAMASQALGPDVKITTASHAAAGPLNLSAPGQPAQTVALPGHCKIEGMINERTGKDGKRYGIGFAIALPDNWNGRFLLMGGGGLNGIVSAPVGPVAAGDTPALARGFAVLSHDSGHKGAVFDNSFMADQRAMLDFAETSVKTVALLGKAIAGTYYGKPVAHSYMTGCSTGGREGMLASQRYPELFDGIIVGAPAMRTGDSNLAIEAMTVTFNQTAPKGTDGKQDFTRVLTAADRKTILDGMLGQCDALDGLKDGMIENVAQCRFDARKLQCKGAKQDGCLSGQQVNALISGMAGPKDKAGYPIYVPFLPDTGIVATPMGYLPTGMAGPLGPPKTETNIDIDARIHELRQNAGQRLIDTNYWTNLNTYLDRGGKIIFYHGVSDFWFSPLATLDYYERAAEENGAAFTDAGRLYMVPGMLHCRGGNAYDNFDMLGALVEWVEGGKAPEAITATRTSPAPASRPLCPYPGYPRYTGGDASKAASFTCAKPEG